MGPTSSSLTSESETGPGSTFAAGLATFALGVGLFPPALALHEALHLLVLRLVGAQGSLIVRPWRFALLDVAIPSLHVQPANALDPGRQLAVNFFGPALAGLLLAVPLLGVRQRWVRLAAVANVAVLAFYAVIESAYVLVESVLHAEADLLTTPEFNYGVPLAIYVAAALLGARRRR